MNYSFNTRPLPSRFTPQFWFFSASLFCFLPLEVSACLSLGRSLQMTFRFLSGSSPASGASILTQALSAPLAPSCGPSGHCMPPKGGLTLGEPTPGGWWTVGAPPRFHLPTAKTRPESSVGLLINVRLALIPSQSLAFSVSPRLSKKYQKCLI